MRWPELGRYDIVFVDTETTGLTYRDRPVGLALKTRDGRKTYLRWGHEGGGNNCTRNDFVNWARVELNRPGLTCVWHNAGFDLRMLAYVGALLDRSRHEDTGFIAAILNELEVNFELNTLAQKYAGMSKNDDALNAWCATHFGGQATRRAQAKNYWRAPGNVVAPYAIGDVDMLHALHDATRPKLADEGLERLYLDVETPLIPILLQMHLRGVRADLEYAGKLRADLSRQRDDLLRRWRKLCRGREVNFNSAVQLEKVWHEHGLTVRYNEPTEKMLLKGRTRGNPSFDKDELEHVDHEVPQTVLQLRQLTYYINTTIDGYVFDNVDERGFIHGEFHPLRNNEFGTVSGRFSSGGGLNLQNIPARDEKWAPLLRGMFVPVDAKTHDWCKIDYSQIEFRFLAHYAGGAVMRAYNDDPTVDFHEMCAQLTGIPRKPAKNINFGLVYGMGVGLMSTKLGLPLDKTRELLNEYHGRLPDVRKMYSRADRRAQRRGYILTWGGRKRRFRKNERGTGYRNTHKALNALLQGSAADLIKHAMVRVCADLDWDESPLHLTVHDELDLSTPKGKRGRAIVRRIVEQMEDFELRVPVRAEAELGTDWGHVNEIEGLR